MAVFFDTGDGDIYGGPTKEAVIAAMQADSDDLDLSAIVEVSGATPMHTVTTVAEEYDESLGAYCIASCE